MTFFEAKCNLNKLKIGTRVLVRFREGESLYAIYSDFDEFDIHIPSYGVEGDYRGQWYKHSSLSVKYFAILNGE